jgi:uncharacterized protein involved in exopolysaccharide biosynthesis/Mrp family chromosome partitioning ATPase
MPDVDPETLKETITLKPVLELAATTVGDVSAEDVGSALYVDEVPRTRVVVIGARSRDPEKSARIANAVMHAFLTFQGERFQHEVENARELLQKRLSQVRARITENQRALSEFATSKGLFDPDSEITSLLAQTTEAQSRMRTLRTELETTKSRSEYIQSRLVKESPTVTTQTVSPGDSARIGELETRLRGLLTRFTPEHPQVQDTMAELDALRNTKGKASRRVQETTQQPNPIYQQLYLQALQADVEARALESELASLERNRRELEERVRTLPLLRAELTELTVERKSAEDLLDDTLGNLARVQELAASPNPLFEILEEAEPPGAPERTRTAIGMIIAAFISLFIGFAVALVSEVRDDRVREKREIESLGLAILGLVPLERHGAGRREEAIRQVAFMLRRNVPEDAGLCVLVTSALEDERKTELSRGVARALTGWLKPVLRVDANLRSASGDPPVLDRYLRGDSEHASVVREAPGLGVITAGSVGTTAPTLLSSDRMDELVASVRSAFRLCLFDGPATLPSVDAEILAEKVDGIVIVVRAFHTPRPRLAAALARLRATGTPIIGAVLMDARTDAATSEAA